MSFCLIQTPPGRGDNLTGWKSTRLKVVSASLEAVLARLRHGNEAVLAAVLRIHLNFSKQDTSPKRLGHLGQPRILDGAIKRFFHQTPCLDNRKNEKNLVNVQLWCPKTNMHLNTRLWKDWYLDDTWPLPRASFVAGSAHQLGKLEATMERSCCAAMPEKERRQLQIHSQWPSDFCNFQWMMRNM